MYSTLKTKTPLRAKKPWKYTRKALKVKRPMNRVGVVGKANIEARRAIAATAENMKLKECEIGPLGVTVGCLKTWPLAPVHRHKRAWYKGDVKLLADPKQWLCGCQVCHDQIEHNPKLTEEVFIKLRGKDE